MKKLAILPSYICEFDVPENIMSKVKNNVSSITWDNAELRENKPYFGRSTPGAKSLHRGNEWKETVEFIEQSVNQASTAILGDHTVFEKLKVCLMWANKSSELQWHHQHRHPWSVLSGIIYVQGNSGDTWMSRVAEQYHSPHFYYVEKEQDMVQEIYKHKIKEGTMVIFPSTLSHSVTENLNKETDRITISFNTFPDGAVGKINELAGLTIKVL